MESLEPAEGDTIITAHRQKMMEYADEGGEVAALYLTSLPLPAAAPYDNQKIRVRWVTFQMGDADQGYASLWRRRHVSQQPYLVCGKHFTTHSWERHLWAIARKYQLSRGESKQLPESAQRAWLGVC